VLAQTIINEAPGPWGEIATGVLAVASGVLGAALQRRNDRQTALHASRHAGYSAVVATFRRTAVESGKAFQAYDRQQANPTASIDLQPYVRAAWDAGDAFGEALDGAALVASRRAREAANPMRAVVALLRQYRPLADDEPGGRPSLDELNKLTHAAQDRYEEVIALDLRTLTRREHLRRWREERKMSPGGAV
jgi:hypothetical protein